MTSGGFLSTASVAVILACVAVLVVASALVFVPLAGPARRRLPFAFCLGAIWALAILIIALIRSTI